MTGFLHALGKLDVTWAVLRCDPDHCDFWNLESGTVAERDSNADAKWSCPAEEKRHG